VGNDDGGQARACARPGRGSVAWAPAQAPRWCSAAPLLVAALLIGRRAPLAAAAFHWRTVAHAGLLADILYLALADYARHILPSPGEAA
jgi:hypothetical protein